MGSNSQEQSPELLQVIVGGLFPNHDPSSWPPAAVDVSHDLRSSIPDLNTVIATEGWAVSRTPVTTWALTTAQRGPVNKAPGPDGIPNLAIKTAILLVPEMFMVMMQRCLNEGVFPDASIIQTLLLLLKTGKPPGNPPAYRPLYLLDTEVKVLERVIFNRLTKYTKGISGLSNNQFGFRIGKSTVDAILSVPKMAEVAIQRKKRGVRNCAVVTLDVRNAFNSTSWVAIADSFQRLSGYLYKILGSYFQNRVLVYNIEVGQKRVQITAMLWNTMYDSVLRLEFPSGVKIVGFADDIILEICGESIEEVELTA